MPFRPEVISCGQGTIVAMTSQLRGRKFFPPLIGFEPMSCASSPGPLTIGLKPLSDHSDIPKWVNLSCSFHCCDCGGGRPSEKIVLDRRECPLLVIKLQSPNRDAKASKNK